MNLEEKKKFIINFAYFAVWIILLFLLFKVAAAYLLPFLIGLFIAYYVQKPSDFIASKTKISRQICAAFLSVIIFIIVIVILCLLGWFLYTQLNTLVKYFSQQGGVIKGYVESFYSHIEQLLARTDGDLQITLQKMTDDALNGFFEKITVFLSNAVTAFIKNLPTMLISCVVTVVATCYIAKDYDRLKKFVKGFISNNLYKKAVEIKNIFSECFLKLIIGYFWLFVITFFELIVGLLLLGIRHFILIAFLIAVIDVLPVIGTGAVLVPWSIIMFLQNDYKLGIGLIILYVLISVAKNFIEPKIIGKQIGINPLFTLLFIFLGLKLGGVFGMLIFPIVLTVLFTYYRRRILEENSQKQ